jgi:polysaccharide export outer membrane protein
VPQAQKIYLNGEVRRPGDYMYEKGLTVHKAITIAGGFTEKASKGSTKILRIVQGKEETFEMTLDSPVDPGDIIVVPQRFF